MHIPCLIPSLANFVSSVISLNFLLSPHRSDLYLNHIISLQFTDVFDRLYKRSFEFQSVIKIWAGSRLLVFLTDPRDVELVLSSHVHIDKSPEYRYFKPWLGDGLLISTGQKWRAHRKLIAPTFHLNVLKSFIDLFNVNSRNTVEKLKKEIGKEFDCHDYMSEATVEMLMGNITKCNTYVFKVNF